MGGVGSKAKYGVETRVSFVLRGPRDSRAARRRRYFDWTSLRCKDYLVAPLPRGRLVFRLLVSYRSLARLVIIFSFLGRCSEQFSSAYKL